MIPEKKFTLKIPFIFASFEGKYSYDSIKNSSEVYDHQIFKPLLSLFSLQISCDITEC